MNYQGNTHKEADTRMLVWRIADKARELQLQQKISDRDVVAKSTLDLRAVGRQKFESSSLATFNKKLDEIKAGQKTTPEDDELPPVQLEFDLDGEDGENGDSEDGGLQI
jgi:hypothetical protein